MVKLLDSFKTKLGKGGGHAETGCLKGNNFINTLTDHQLAELLAFAESLRITELIPNLTAKKVLYLGCSSHHSLKQIRELEAPFLVYYQMGEELAPREEGITYLRGPARPLPLKSGFFDTIIFPGALAYKQDALDIVEGLAGLLANGSRAIVSFIHPQLEYLIFNQNPRSTARSAHSLEGYFHSLTQLNLFVEDILESAVGKDLKPFFTVNQKQDYFEEFKGFPLVLYFRTIKYVKNLAAA